MEEFVGQHQNLVYLKRCASQNALPRFLLFVGAPRTGKRTLAKYVAKKLIKSQPTETQPGIDNVRAVIATAYKAVAPTCYIFPDCQEMTSAALNALLKVTEEPPKQAHFILTATRNVLTTLHSRACVLTMEPYTPQQLELFTTNKDALAICDSPGSVLALGDSASELYAFCNKFLDSVAVVTGVNAFKIPAYLSLKADQPGYDLQMFFKGIRAVCFHRCKHLICQDDARDVHTILRLYDVMRSTEAVEKQTQNKSVRKDSLVDKWILDVRRILKEDAQ